MSPLLPLPGARQLLPRVSGGAVRLDRRGMSAPHLNEVDRYNRRFYERCWEAASVLPLPGVVTPVREPGIQLEIGCGLRPRLSLSEALFVDVSPSACAKLKRAGARVLRASIDALPFADGTISQLCLFDVLEHVGDGVAVGDELARVCARNARLVVSARLGASWLTRWPRAAFRWQERALRLFRGRWQPTRLRPAGVDEFVAEVMSADGAVTAWRRLDPL